MPPRNDPSAPFGWEMQKAALKLSTDCTDSTDGKEPEAPSLRGFDITRRVKRPPLPTGSQSV